MGQRVAGDRPPEITTTLAAHLEIVRLLARRMQLHVGKRYTRQQIRDLVGGGDLQSYLPHAGGRILCGCFDPTLNKRAPAEIDFGDAPDVIRYAKLAEAQHAEIPVFLKRSINKWEYVGDFRVIRVSTDTRDMERARRRRPDAIGIIFLTEITERPSMSFAFDMGIPLDVNKAIETEMVKPARHMNMFELGYLAWPVLVQAAKERRIINYGDLAVAIGYRGARPTRFALEPIQNLCMEKGWPPLTSIVVNKANGLPGKGFIAWPGDIKEAHAQVFAFPWEELPRPFPPNHRRRFIPSPDTNTRPPDNFEVPDEEVLVNGRGPYQERFRQTLLRLYRGRCALCDTRFPSALIASHIVPWAADRRNRLNPRNGVLLCQTHDAVFEAGLLRIGKDYRIMVGSLDGNTLGRDLAAYLRDSTAPSLRLPAKESRPAPEFLEWRLTEYKREESG